MLLNNTLVWSLSSKAGSFW